MKKFSLVFVILLVILLVSCKKTNQYDNNSSSNPYYVSSDEASTSNKNNLPERKNPTGGSAKDNASSKSDSDADSAEEGDQPQISLSIYVNKPYYRKTVKIITFTLYNNNKNIFTYETDFFLQVYKDGDWKYCTTKSGDINYTHNTAESESYIQPLVLNLKNLYDLPFEPGTYRIVQESSDGTLVKSDEFKIVEDSYFDGEEAQEMQ